MGILILIILFIVYCSLILGGAWIICGIQKMLPSKLQQLFDKAFPEKLKPPYDKLYTRKNKWWIVVGVLSIASGTQQLFDLLLIVYDHI